MRFDGCGCPAAAPSCKKGAGRSATATIDRADRTGQDRQDRQECRAGCTLDCFLPWLIGQPRTVGRKFGAIIRVHVKRFPRYFILGFAQRGACHQHQHCQQSHSHGAGKKGLSYEISKTSSYSVLHGFARHPAVLLTTCRNLSIAPLLMSHHHETSDNTTASLLSLELGSLQVRQLLHYSFTQKTTCTTCTCTCNGKRC